MEGNHASPFNFGNPGEFTMLELAQVICLHSDYMSFPFDFLGGYAIYFERAGVNVLVFLL